MDFIVTGQVRFEGKGRLLAVVVNVEGLVAVLAGADGDGILDGDDPDAAVAYFAGLSRGDDGVDGLLDIAIPDDNGEKSALDAARVVDDAAVDSSLTSLADAPDVVVGEPLNVGSQEGVSHIIELCFSDDSFNLFHDYRSFSS